MNRRTLPLLAALAVLALASVAHARFEWRDVRQVVTIQANGSIIVEDARTLWTNEDFGEVFLCIQHESDIKLTLLEGSGSIDNRPFMPARTQACESGAQGTELVAGDLDTRYEGERRILFRYRLDGALQVHLDVVQWYWEIYGRENIPPAINYHLTVHAPGPMNAPYDAHVHRFNNLERPDVTLTEDRSRLDVRFDRIPAGEGVEIRWLMPPRLFTMQGDNLMLEAYLEDEARIAQINVPGAPTLTAEAPATITSGTLSIDGRAYPNTSPIERVTATPRAGETIPCTGRTTFTCILEDLPLGITTIDLLAYAEDGRIGSSTLTVNHVTPTDDLPLDPEALANRTPIERHVDAMFSNAGIVRFACPDLQVPGVRAFCGDVDVTFSTFRDRWDDAFDDPFDVPTPAAADTSWTLQDGMLVRVFHLQGQPNTPFYVAFSDEDPYNQVVVFHSTGDTP